MAQAHDYEEVDERFEATLRTVIQAIHGREGKDKVSVALLLLLVRESNTWRTIRLLSKHTPPCFHDAFMVDAGTLLRAMFDAYLQADLILRDLTKRSERALLYLEFEHVERYRMLHRTLSHDNPYARLLQASPFRPDGEARVQQEFDRVKDKYLVEPRHGRGTVKHGTRTRDKWYKGSLSQLAAASRKEAEYDTFVTSFSGCVHSSALAVTHGPMVPEAHVLVLASTFTARIAKMNVEYNQLDIGDERPLLDELCKCWLDDE